MRHSQLRMAVDPRKSPKQRRSRVTIDVILEATARIVGQVGLDRATTNRIAEVAGVSIGSLYQYFPGKEALLAALIEREASADLEALRVHFEASASLPLAVAIDRACEELVARHARNPGLYRWMLTYVPALGQHAKIRAIAAQGRALLRDMLGRRRGELDRELEPALAAMILGSAIEAAVHTAIFERPETLGDGTLARELGRLCRGYLGVSSDD
ncbi:MAG: TetR/AcrR family transcriptional regulator [Deltaproteobacteria bacterium]|nr:TetR/AcrR family transcriptional regulator [Deltaproteobacteria bacterium]